MAFQGRLSQCSSQLPGHADRPRGDRHDGSSDPGRLKLRLVAPFSPLLRGYGFFGAHGPAGTRLFTSSLLIHAFYGIGLWLGVSIVA
jgi:hypothetical protein